jgi:hypothetical protein
VRKLHHTGLDRNGLASGADGATPVAPYARPQERSRS